MTPDRIATESLLRTGHRAFSASRSGLARQRTRTGTAMNAIVSPAMTASLASRMQDLLVTQRAAFLPQPFG